MFPKHVERVDIESHHSRLEELQTTLSASGKKQKRGASNQSKIDKKNNATQTIFKCVRIK